MKSFKLLIISLLCCVYTSWGQTIYVKAGANGTGTSWSDATGNLQTALAIATSGTSIWVQNGVYYPTSCTSCSKFDRQISFNIPDGVSLYGGFDGTESNLNDRDVITNLTILSGDINQDNTPSSNSYTIVYTDNVSANTLVDGFIIEQANADSTSMAYGSEFNSGGGWFNQASLGGSSHPTVRNCIFRDNYAFGYAGAMLNDASFSGEAFPSIENCTFENNIGNAGGGAMYNRGEFEGKCNVQISHSTFINNSSNFDGGAISNVGIENGETKPNIINCTFENNNCQKHGGAVFNFGKNGFCEAQIDQCTFLNNYGDLGGAIFNDGSFSGIANGKISNSLFQYNSSQSAGGAIYNLGSENGVSSPTYYNCEIIENSSNGSGAGIFNNAINGTSNPSISNCTILSNAAGAYGGGIYNLGKSGECSPKITNCVVAKNSGLSAGGMYNLGSQNGVSSPIVTNCTFYGNSALVGGGIYSNASDSTGTSSPIITNTIVWGNTADFGAVFRNILGNPTIEYCVVDRDSCSALNSGAGSNVMCGNGVLFNIDPMFVDAANNDFHLLPSSPLLDMGDNSSTMNAGVMVDLDSIGRINNGTVDIGAYEYNAVVYVNASILNSPASDSICVGEDLTLSVAGTGTPPLFYQWFKDGIPLSGANNASLSISNAVGNQSGDYTCRVNGTQMDTVFSSLATIIVKPNLNLTATVSSSSNNICEGELLNFTSSITNGGISPSYNWILNGESTGTTTSNYSTSSLADGDIVGVIVSSSEQCITNSIVTSNAITMDVLSNVTPEINIQASTTSICANEMVTFTSTVSNEGVSPSFQWQVNGVNVGTTTTSFSSNTLNDGDQVACVLTSSATCLSSNNIASNIVNIVVSTPSTPTIDISASQTSICAGEEITFNTTSTFEGVDPSYQWLVNGVNVGTNTASFISNNLNDGDEVTCILTSSESCVTSNSAMANSVLIEVIPPLQPSLNIAANTLEVCEGETISFSASTIDEGQNPNFVWMINGIVQAENTSSFSSNNFSNGDEVVCTMEIVESCTTNSTATSNALSVNVNPNLVPDINIDVVQDSLCAGEAMTFMANSINVGETPAYEWYVNGNLFAGGAPNFSSTGLENGDEIVCVVYSSETCAAEVIDTSNSIVSHVLPLIYPDINIQASDTEICVGDPVLFTSLVANEGMLPSFEWYVNDTLQMGGTDSLIINNLEDGDIIKAVLLSNENCLAIESDTSNAIEINVMEALEASIEIIQMDSIICAGDSVFLGLNTEYAGTSPQLTWFVNGDSIANSPSFVASNLNNEDLIFCELQSSASCILNTVVVSETIAMDIQPILTPNAYIEATDTTLCPGDTLFLSATTFNVGDNPTYDWIINGQITGINSPLLEIYNVIDGDEIYCTISTNEECLSTNELSTDFIEIEVLSESDCTTSTQFLSSEYGYSIFPNPTNGEVHISWQHEPKEVHYQLFDNVGKALSSPFSNNQFDLSKLPKGIYFLKVLTNEGIFVDKVVVE